MVARAFDLAFALVYFRFLREAGTGTYQFLVVVTTYLDTLVDFGLNTVVARDVSRAPSLARASFRAVGLLRIGLWLLGLPLIAIVYGPARAALNLPAEAAPAGWIFYLALLPSILAKGASALLWALDRLELTGYVSMLSTLLKTGFGVIALVLGAGLVGLAGSSMAVNLVSATALTLLLLREHRRHAAAAPAPAPDPAPAAGEASADAVHPWQMARASWPFFLNQLLQSLFFKVDSILLPPLASTQAAGAYAAAYKVNEGLGTVSSNFTLALFPRLARQAGLGRETLREEYRFALRLLLQIALPLAAGTALLAGPIMALVGGRGFLPDSAIALTVLIWYLPFSFANGLTQYVLIAAGRQRFLTGAFFAAFVFNVAANSLAIPRYGYFGAAVVTVLSELVLLVPFRWAIDRSVGSVSLLREARAPLLATLLMAPVVWWLRDAINPVAAIVAGCLVYPVGLWSLGGVDELEWQLLAHFVPSRWRQRLGLA